MITKITLPKFLNLSLIFLGAFILPFLPLTKPTSPPAVKAASTSILTVPFFDKTPVGSISAQAVYVYDPESRSALFEKNATTKLHPASLTKLMTALIAINSYQLDQVLTVRSAADSLGSSVHLISGDRLTVENLLYAALVASGNDAAVTLAENYPAGYSRFVDKMNQKALSLGLTDTHFTNVAGMEDDVHKTTAKDLTLLAISALENPIIARIVNTQKKIIPNVSNTHHYLLTTTNDLLGTLGVIGVKTGTSQNAGQNLTILSTQNGHSVFITLLNSTDRFADATTLINWVFTHFQWKEI